MIFIAGQDKIIASFHGISFAFAFPLLSVQVWPIAHRIHIKFVFESATVPSLLSIYRPCGPILSLTGELSDLSLEDFVAGEASLYSSCLLYSEIDRHSGDVIREQSDYLFLHDAS
jgi:hypothetical protein